MLKIILSIALAIYITIEYYIKSKKHIHSSKSIILNVP